MTEEQELTGRARQLAALAPHRFKPGQSGNPSGRPKNVLSKAIRKKLEEVEEGQDKTVAERVTDRLVDLALAGNIEAIKLLGDRSEGRPRQSISVDTDERERRERKLQNFLTESEREGDPLTRDEAIAILAEEDSGFEDFE
jgi:Family of unknown function (DUF5681)